MSVFVHGQGIKTVHAGGGIKWQNSVHVVIEWPLKQIYSTRFFPNLAGLVAGLVEFCTNGIPISKQGTYPCI